MRVQPIVRASETTNLELLRAEEANKIQEGGGRRLQRCWAWWAWGAGEQRSPSALKAVLASFQAGFPEASPEESAAPHDSPCGCVAPQALALVKINPY